MFRLRECGWQEFFDIGHFAERVSGSRILTGVFYFRARPSMPPIKTQAQYWAEVQHLQKLDQQLWADYGQLARSGYMVKGWRGWQEKRADVWLASQMLHDVAAAVYDTAILVTADTDFVPAVELVRMLGKNVELVVFPRARPNISRFLNEVDLIRTARRSWFRPYP